MLIIENLGNFKLHTIRLTYIGRDELIALVDECFPEYWRHDDIRLIQSIPSPRPCTHSVRPTKPSRRHATATARATTSCSYPYP